MNWMGFHIIPCDELSGSTSAYQAGSEVYVSKAVYTLLEDPTLFETMTKQLKLKNLRDLVDQEVKNYKRKRN